MNITFKIQRFHPGKDKKPYYQTYIIDMEKTDRVLDGLVYIKRNLDDSLSFRKSCAHGVCGSDGMRINGREKLACKVLIQDVVKNKNDAVLIEPLRHMKVQRDLMVDQTDFFNKFTLVKPYFLPEKEIKEKEYIQTPGDRKKFDDGTKCINCGCCYSACPVLDKNPDFLGPAALVYAARFVFDSRDKGLQERLEILHHANGVWACENHFECTRVCPRGIKVTKLINLTKRLIKKQAGRE
jgi:succinate dehydrogenase / fumarate reductase iron-sulfur subunit